MNADQLAADRLLHDAERAMDALFSDFDWPRAEVIELEAQTDEYERNRDDERA